MMASFLIGNKAAYAMDAAAEKKYFIMDVGTLPVDYDGDDRKSDTQFHAYIVDASVTSEVLAAWMKQGDDIEYVMLDPVKKSDTLSSKCIGPSDLQKSGALIKFLRENKDTLIYTKEEINTYLAQKDDDIALDIYITKRLNGSKHNDVITDDGNGKVIRKKLETAGFVRGSAGSGGTTMEEESDEEDSGTDDGTDTPPGGSSMTVPLILFIGACGALLIFIKGGKSDKYAKKQKKSTSYASKDMLYDDIEEEKEAGILSEEVDDETSDQENSSVLMDSAIDE